MVFPSVLMACDQVIIFFQNAHLVSPVSSLDIETRMEEFWQVRY